MYTWYVVYRDDNHKAVVEQVHNIVTAFHQAEKSDSPEVYVVERGPIDYSVWMVKGNDYQSAINEVKGL